jgi:hypothetical protein
MSELVPNVIDSAKVFRNAKMFGRFETNSKNIVLITPFLAFEVAKREPKGRFFADNNMIKHGGGPWFIQKFHSLIEARRERLSHNQQQIDLGNIEAKDLFSYRTCSFELKMTQDRRAPIALQLVQKAELLALADEILADIVSEIS